MSKTTLMSSVTSKLHNIGFQAKKHSPEILAVVGTVGVVTSAVMACKATTKVSTILDESKETVDKIHECAENPELEEKYSAEDSKKDLAIVYAQTGVKIVKLYGPSVVLGVASLGCLLGSNNILRKRNIALAAAYTTLSKDFKGYRSRVVERFGEALDRELRYNIKAEEIEETVVNEKGKEKTVKKTVEVIDPSTLSDYARFFDDGCIGWSKDPEQNLMFLRQQQSFLNDKLKARARTSKSGKGHLFLNEVYEALGIPKTKAGQIVGWTYDEEDPIGDNFVDFGLYDSKNERVRAFVNGYERTILLNFNVDGPILNLI